MASVGSIAHPQIQLVPLGAGQDVGRSCVLLRMGGKHIMLDCGMHMGYNDDRRFPDFSYIAPYHPSTNYTSMIDCVIISHFHLDHCGALPFFTECLGYDGPIYMTYPTRKIAPILLEDFRKIMVEKRAAHGTETRNSISAGSQSNTTSGTTSLSGSTRTTNPMAQITPDSFFTEADIKNCMKKVIPVDVNQAIQVDPQLTIRAYYAGHVLGAAMFHIQVTVPVTNSVSCPSASFTFHPFNTPRLPHPSLTCVYTGDYNTTPDRHLGPAQIDRCRPDVLVTETTYATYTRDSKRTREQAFLEACHQTVAQGGKVLIPVFALGRAQELCILVDGYWERMGRELQKVPVYFSAGLTEKANEYYKLFLQWTNESLRESFVERNPFDFKHIRPFTHMTQADAPTPMVLFATPGMLHAGTSLNIFLKWCSNPLNAVILPGYCVPGTVGARVLAGERIIPLDRWTNVEVRCKVYNLSFSAHADAKGIMSLISACEPKNVVLIHGEKSKMAMLKERIVKEKGIPCFDPGNGTTVTIEVARDFVARVDRELILNAWKDETLRRKKIAAEKYGNGAQADEIILEQPIGTIDLTQRLRTLQRWNGDAPAGVVGHGSFKKDNAIPLSAALVWDRTVLPRVESQVLPDPASAQSVAPLGQGRGELNQGASPLRDSRMGKAFTESLVSDEDAEYARYAESRNVDLGAGMLTLVDVKMAQDALASGKSILANPELQATGTASEPSSGVKRSDTGIGQQWIHHRVRKSVNISRLYLSMLKEPGFVVTNASAGVDLPTRMHARLVQRIVKSLQEYVGKLEEVDVTTHLRDDAVADSTTRVVVGTPRDPHSVDEDHEEARPGIVVVEVELAPGADIRFCWAENLGPESPSWNAVNRSTSTGSAHLGLMDVDVKVKKVTNIGGGVEDQFREHLDISTLADRVMTVVSWLL